MEEEKNFLEVQQEWEDSFCCDNCGNTNHKEFNYGWTCANGEVWDCKLCHGNTIVDEQPD